MEFPAVVNDPLSLSFSEGDIIYQTMSAIFTPVNLVLNKYSRGVQIASFSETSHSALVTIRTATGDTTVAKHLSRVDRLWAFWNGQDWVKFAVVEFKRPGAIEDGDWETAIQGGQVDGLGAAMCRQVVKYCYSYNVR